MPWEARLHHVRTIELRNNEGLELLAVDSRGNAYVREDYYQMTGCFVHLCVSPEGEVIHEVRRDDVDGLNPALEKRVIPFKVEGTLFRPSPPHTVFPFHHWIDPERRRGGPVEGPTLSKSFLAPLSPTEEAELRVAFSRLVGTTGQPGRIFGRDGDRAIAEVALGDYEMVICRTTTVTYERRPEHQTVDNSGVLWSEGRASIDRLQFVDARDWQFETFPMGTGVQEFTGPRQLVDTGKHIYVGDGVSYRAKRNKVHILERL